MKKPIAGFLFCFCMALNAQSPSLFSYQMVVRDGSQQVLANSQIGIQISILKGSSNGNVVYRETHAVKTNINGLASLEVGGGNVLSGLMNNIDWANGPYFLKTETDLKGGNQYTLDGTVQLLSVPYALFAGNVKDTSSTNEIQMLSRKGDTVFLSRGGFIVLPKDNDSDPVNELQILSRSNDTLYLSKGGFVVLPKDNDSDSTNEIQLLSRNRDTLFLSKGNIVLLPMEADADSTNEIQIISRKGDTLFLSKGGFVTLPKPDSASIAKMGFITNKDIKTSSGFKHFVGEKFGGGVVFHVWKDTSGNEHGLVVATSWVGSSEVWSNITAAVSPSAKSYSNGLINSLAIVGQTGHTNSAAKLCIDLVSGGYSDWYLPAEYELLLLWQNNIAVNRTLATISGAKTMPYETSVWSSTETSGGSSAYGVNFDIGNATFGSGKGNRYYVWPIRAY